MRIESSITTDAPLSLSGVTVSTALDNELDDTSSDITTSDDSDHMYGGCDHATCEDCKQREHVALLDSLPPSVVTGEERLS